MIRIVLSKKIINLCLVSIVALGATLIASAQQAKAPICLNRITQKEWTILVRDLSPTAKKTLESPEGRKVQIENLRQLLAMACEARRLGLDQDETNAAELGYIASETTSSVFDEYLSKGKTGPPFARITDIQVAQFYNDPKRIFDFDRFLEVKTALIRRAVPTMTASSITVEEKLQAKEQYAKFKLGEKARMLVPPAVRVEADFKSRLQQAQFLARVYAEQLADDITVSNDEVTRYIASHPEFDVSAKKEKANKILARAKAGEDFAALANEFSDDPGNTGDDGKKNGGLYSDVPLGQMVPSFEKAAIALKPGEISELVETDFGFHIIKLEARSASKYDVRHILISTMFNDPNDPSGRDVPASVYARNKLEDERQSAVLKDLVAKNPIVIEDQKPAAPVSTRPASRVVRKKR